MMGQGVRIPAPKREAIQVDTWSIGLIWLMPVAVVFLVTAVVAVYLSVLDRQR
jgi:hypothetical protein